MGPLRSFPSSVARWIRRQFVDDVPTHMAICEFNCNKLTCRSGDWSACERRRELTQIIENPQRRPKGESGESSETGQSG